MPANGVIYFAQAGKDGPIKIGTTVDVESRLSQIQTGCPQLVTPVAMATGGYRFESLLHRAFGFCRLIGEWFAPHPELCEVIRRINARESDSAGREIAPYQPCEVAIQTDGVVDESIVWKHIDEMNRKQWLAVVAMRKKHVKESWDRLVTDNDYWNTKVAAVNGWRQVELRFV